MVNTLSMFTQPITMVHSHVSYGTLDQCRRLPFCPGGISMGRGVSFNFTFGLKEGILPIYSSLLLSLLSWAFWRSCNCLGSTTHSGPTPLTCLTQYTLGSQSCFTTTNSWSLKWSWILLWPLGWLHDKTKLPSGMDSSFSPILRALCSALLLMLFNACWFAAWINFWCFCS